MSGSRGARKKKVHEDEHPDERWMASYMDMITVLMCMFIVLYAMSTVDQDKYVALRNSLATGFGQTELGAIDSASGTVVPVDQVTPEGEGYSAGDETDMAEAAASGEAETGEGTETSEALAKSELDDLTAIKAAIEANLDGSGLSADVQFATDARGLTVRLVGSETFFGTNSADLSAEATRVMDAIAPVLSTSAHDVSVEGHADQRSSTAPFATNWELSSARATQVLRDLVERGGMPVEHIQAVGFGSSRPLAAGGSPADLAANRRVDIVVLSNQSDDVSALLPELQRAAEGAGGAVTAGRNDAAAEVAATTAEAPEPLDAEAPAADEAPDDAAADHDSEGAQSGGH
ncbi:flagellar motor protein MotB [Frigoribacterium sp. CFBP9039]|uniref:flagellar motor protein MotB n=1 Tax=unclassified Frigoribacterium TaxID=2627005 RepID=UPI00178529EA|nr:flagellar motor protein MotB [Frigoribacterium sp. CFBP9039]MBD8704140.1 flagellar motor protein MotB [Frigoribacterium sp. CFBP 13712]MDY0945401.1 flagellar motor protein MotB [Frigoribacterium sp. CFBP9039]